MSVLKHVATAVTGLLVAVASGFTFAQELKGDPEAAKKEKVAMCVGCHGIPGYRTAFPAVYHVPKIGGQQAAYIVSALRAYKTGARAHPSMRGIAESLSDQDMADLAAYYSKAK